MTEVSVEDLERLATEIRDGSGLTGPEWLEQRTPVLERAMLEFLDAAESFVMDNACCKQHASDAIITAVAEAFRLGWEVRDQYGRKNEERKTLCCVHEPGACPPGCEHAYSFEGGA